MAAIVTTPNRIFAARQYISNLSNSDTNLYVFIGKSTAWSNDTVPPTPTPVVDEQLEAWRDMYALKRVSSSDTSLVIPRNDWKAGIIYTEYIHDVDLFDTTLGLRPFYVITNPDLNVYKCLSNVNGRPSTVKPTGTSTNIISTSDGYLWKFMFNVDSVSASAFLTNEWIPVETLLSDNGSAQWDVQQTARLGPINKINIIEGGSGYTSAPTVTITGDGTGATAEATIENGIVTAISVKTTGSNYTTATVAFSGGTGSGASAKAVIAPPRGHGSDPEAELGARVAMLNVKFLQDEQGKFTVDNDFRKTGIVYNPKLWGTSTAATALTYKQTLDLTFPSTIGDFVADETITGGTSGATGVVVDFNSTSNVLRLSETVGTFQPGETVSNVGGSGASGVLSDASGTAQSGSLTTITLAVSDTAVTDAYAGYTIRITSGTGAGQQRIINTNNSGTKIVTVGEAWTITPDNTSVYNIANVNFPEIEPSSGRILFLEYRRPIQRASDQLEDIKIPVSF